MIRVHARAVRVRGSSSVSDLWERVSRSGDFSSQRENRGRGRERESCLSCCGVVGNMRVQGQ